MGSRFNCTAMEKGLGIHRVTLFSCRHKPAYFEGEITRLSILLLKFRWKLWVVIVFICLYIFWGWRQRQVQWNPESPNCLCIWLIYILPRPKLCLGERYCFTRVILWFCLSVYLFVILFICLSVIRITRKIFDRFSWNLTGSFVIIK